MATLKLADIRAMAKEQAFNMLGIANIPGVKQIDTAEYGFPITVGNDEEQVALSVSVKLTAKDHVGTKERAPFDLDTAADAFQTSEADKAAKAEAKAKEKAEKEAAKKAKKAEADAAKATPAE